MTVVGEASTGEEALGEVGEVEPDVVVLDLTMPGQGALEATKEIKRRRPGTGVVILGSQREERFAWRCFRGGADAWVSKNGTPAELVEAIRRVARGGKYMSRRLGERLVRRLGGDLEGMAHERLSDRELQVLQKIASGHTVSEIARELVLSVKTVSTYRSRVLEKLDLVNNAQLMQFAMEERLVEWPSVPEEGRAVPLGPRE